MDEIIKTLKYMVFVYTGIFAFGHVISDLNKEIKTTCLQSSCNEVKSKVPELVEGKPINQPKETDMSAKLLADPKIAALVEKEVAKAIKAERKRCLDAVKASAKSLTDEVKDPAPFDTDD